MLRKPRKTPTVRSYQARGGLSSTQAVFTSKDLKKLSKDRRTATTSKDRYAPHIAGGNTSSDSLDLVLHSFFFIRIYFIRIPRLKFANF